jgi:hypothetical protein
MASSKFRIFPTASNLKSACCTIGIEGVAWVCREDNLFVVKRDLDKRNNL